MKVKAFTLPELLSVLVIIGILVLLALPRLMPLISRTKATEAQLQLRHLQTLQKSNFYMHSKYSDDYITLGFEQEEWNRKSMDARQARINENTAKYCGNC